MTAIESMLDYYDIPYSSGTREQSIRCPVHEDAHASASYNPDKELFNCHACGASGSVYDMVMQKEGVDFATAQRRVEGITGVRRESSGGTPRPRAPVPPGSGYRPRVRKKVSSRSGGRLSI